MNQGKLHFILRAIWDIFDTWLEILLKLFFFTYSLGNQEPAALYPSHITFPPFHNGIATPGSMHRQLDLIEPQQAAASPEFGFLYSRLKHQELRKGRKIVGIYKYKYYWFSISFQEPGRLYLLLFSFLFLFLLLLLLHLLVFHCNFVLFNLGLIWMFCMIHARSTYYPNCRPVLLLRDSMIKEAPNFWVLLSTTQKLQSFSTIWSFPFCPAEGWIETSNNKLQHANKVMDEVPWNKIDIEDTHLTQGSFQENKKITSFCALRRVTAFPHRSLFHPFAVFLNEKTNVMNSKPMWSRIDFVPL